MSSVLKKDKYGINITRKLTLTAIMVAISVVLQFLELSVPFVPAFIKLDFSDLPSLIVSFAYGGPWGVLVCFLKNLIKAIFFSNTAMVGEFANFLLGTAFVLPAGIIYRKIRTIKGALLGSFVGAAICAALSFPINYFITYPFYTSFMPMDAIMGMYQAILPTVSELWEALLIFNVPFTFVKLLCSVVITLLIYKKISPFFKGKKE